MTSVDEATVDSRRQGLPSALRRRLARWLPTVSLGALLGYLVLVPLGLLLWSSLKPTGLPRDPGLTLSHYVEIYTDPYTYELMWTSLVFAVGSTVLALMLGTTLAWLVERTDMPGRRVFRMLVILPMAMPPILLAIAWVLLLSPRIGFFNNLVVGLFGFGAAPFDIYTMWGMVFVQGLSLVPTTFLLLAPSFRNMDPNLEEAALTSGARPLTLVRRIILPVVSPAIFAAAAFLLIVGMVIFDIPGILGLPVGIFVLSSEVFFRAQPPSGLPQYGEISALVVSFLAILLILSAIYHRQIRHSQRFVTITGRGYRARPFRLGRWRWAATCVAALYFFLAVLAPLGILAWTSLLPFYSGVSSDMVGQLSLSNHATLLSDPRVLGAAWHSIIIAVVAASTVAFLSAVISWVVVRSRAPGRRAIDVLAFLPLAVPSIMIGLALIYVYLTIRFVPVYGTIWIIAIAYITVYLSFGTRVTNGVMLQMHAELEEAAQTSGAPWVRTFRKITVPLMRPALLAVWIWTAAHALRELSAALMLQGRDNAVVPTLLWGYWEGGQPTVAAATGFWLIVALLGLVIIWDRMTRSEDEVRIGG